LGRAAKLAAAGRIGDERLDGPGEDVDLPERSEAAGVPPSGLSSSAFFALPIPINSPTQSMMNPMEYESMIAAHPRRETPWHDRRRPSSDAANGHAASHSEAHTGRLLCRLAGASQSIHLWPQSGGAT
jgi:hypothetical protein